MLYKRIKDEGGYPYECSASSPLSSE